MASDLMLIKSKMLLPHEEGTENDPRREIQDALILYQQAKLAAKELRPMYDEFSGRFVKGTDDIPPEKGLPLNLDPDLLVKALSAVMKRIKIAESAKHRRSWLTLLLSVEWYRLKKKLNRYASFLKSKKKPLSTSYSKTVRIAQSL